MGRSTVGIQVVERLVLCCQYLVARSSVHAEDFQCHKITPVWCSVLS